MIQVIDSLGQLKVTGAGGGGGGGITALNFSAGTTSNNISDSVVFSNSNGVSFGLDGSTITAQHNGLTSQSNQAFSAQGGSSAFQTLVFTNSNGFSFSNTGGSIWGSYTVPSTAGLLSAINVSGGTTSNNLSALVFSNSNGVSFGLNGSTVTATVKTDYLTTAMASNRGSDFVQATAAFAGTNASGTIASDGISVSVNAQSAVPQNASLYALGNTTQNSSTQLSVNALSFNAIGSITMGYSNGSIQVSAPNALTSQSNQAFSAQGGSSAFQTLIFTNSNGISFSNTNGSVWGSHNGITSQTNQDVTLYATGNTTQNSSTVLNASSLLFRGTGNASIGFSNGSIIVSDTGAAGGGLTNINISAGTTSNNLSNFVFSNSNRISFGLDGSTVTAQHAFNYSAGTTSNDITNGVVFSNSNGVSFGLNGSTVTASVSAPVTVSRYNEFKESPMVVGAIGNGTLHFQPWLIPNLHMDRVILHNQFSNATNSSGSFTLSQWVGLYTQNVSTLSLLSSTSMSTNFTGSGTVGSYSLYGGIRGVSIGWTNTITEGMYWIGVIHRTTSGGANQTVSQLLNSNINSTYSGILGEASNATKQWTLGLGGYTASTSSLPNSVAFTQINGNSSIFIRPPSLYFISGTV